MPANGDCLTSDGVCPDMPFKISASGPPPKPSSKETTRQIEVLCQYIAKNGPTFEVAARTKEHQNPKFAFLFGGEPGSEAAIEYEYFKWMKGKCLMESKLHSGSEQSDPPLGPSRNESSRSPDKHTSVVASRSPSESDVDMEDDIQQFNNDQSVGAPVKISKEFDPMFKEVFDVKSQQVDEQCMTDDPTRTNALKAVSSFGNPILSTEERESDVIPPWGLAGDSECMTSTQNLDVPVKDLTPQKASPTAAAANINSKKLRDPVSDMGSPFRLIQDYASDDSDEANDGPSFEDVSPKRAPPSITVDEHEVKKTNGDMLTGCLSSPFSGKESLSLPESHLVHHASMPPPNISTETAQVVEATDAGNVPSDATANINEVHPDGHDIRDSDDLGCGNSSQGDDIVASENGKFQKGGERQSSSALKVDEFGRMVREGASDSESDVDHYTGRPYRRGRSRSPLDRRSRKSHSPRRRNEKRNRSRSWSPRKRRSTSRSPPASRHTGEFSGEKKRRDRGPTQDCFDFRKGRCYRGASCRFLHNGAGTGDASRRHRSRQEDMEHFNDPRRSSVQEESRSSVEMHDSNTLPAKHEHNAVEEEATKTQMPSIDMDISIPDVPNDSVLDATTDVDPLLDVVVAVTSFKGDQSVPVVILDVGQSDSVGTTDQGAENEPVMQSSIYQVDEISKLPVEINKLSTASQPITEVETVDMSPSSEPTSPVNADCHSSPAKVSNGEASETNAPLLVEQHSHTQSVDTSHTTPSESLVPQVLASNEFQRSDSSGVNNQLQHSQLPPPPPPPPLGTAQASQPSRDYNLPPGDTNVHPHSSSPYQAPNDQYPQAPSISKPSWTSLPPPPPLYMQGSTSTAISYSQSSHPSQFQQYPSTLMRPYPQGQPTHPQGFDYHSPASVPLMQNQPREYSNVLGDERFPRSSVLDGSRYHLGPQQGSSLHPPQQLREEHHYPHQVHDGARNFQTLPNQRLTGFMAQDNLHSQAFPFPNDPPAKRLQSFSDGNSHHNPFLREDFGGPTLNKSFPPHHQPHPPFGLQWSGPGNFPSHSGSVEQSGTSVRRYPLSFEDDSKRPHLPFADGSRISAHFNPFASTFENIHGSSIYRSNIKQESLTSVGRFDSLGLNQGSQPAVSQSQGKILSESGDPYDPLFDSIEPSKASRTFDFVDGRDLHSDVISREVAARSTIEPLTNTKSSYSHGAANTEQKEQIDGTTNAAVTSPENDEFGEGAIDTEIGALESESPDNAVDAADTAIDDAETEQAPSKGKSKKSKDSRSMKLFKVALADFVKDVLKPSWRQGNMSKEAFKTIVKKTVDKVAGAMKNHQIPKGQAKINQYVESSQRKLTKLVMGYVDKYVKA